METVETLGLTYNTILHAYQSFFDGSIVGDVLKSLKILAIAIFLLSVGTNMISTMGGKWALGEAKLPYDQNKFITSFLFVLVIIFFNRFLDLMDSLFLPIDSYFSTYEHLGIINDATDTITDDTVQPWYVVLKETANLIKDALTFNTGTIFLSAVLGLAKIVDAMIYVVFLVERFFFLGLIKILGPFGILFSIYSSKRDMFIKWLKIYVSIYLLIIPFYLVIGFTSEIIKTINITLATQSPVTDIFFGRSIITVAILIIIWIKLRLFKKSYDLVYKVIS